MSESEKVDMATPWRPVCSVCGKETIDPLKQPISCLTCEAEWDGSELSPDGTMSGGSWRDWVGPGAQKLIDAAPREDKPLTPPRRA